MAKAKATTRLYTFRVIRWVREEYSVEIESTELPTMKQVEENIQDPHKVEVERESIQQVKARRRVRGGHHG